jgi:predicted polyphosphate/ATP-dependent NAD kinase
VRVLGLIVNPVAGIGGRYALKGSDDAAAIARAVEQGAVAVAPLRARRALVRLRAIAPEVDVLAPVGPMGADVAAEAGVRVTTLDRVPAAPSTAEDTRAAASELAERGVDLLLFAGGDGTARDVVDAVGTAVPVLGVPSGVKMRSSVFATSPEQAGEAAARYLAQPEAFGLIEREVLDAADAQLDSELFAIARVPSVPDRLQRGKSGPSGSGDGDLAELCEDIARGLEPGRLYLLGPGTTTDRIMRALGLAGTPLGVDAVRDGALLEADLTESRLLDLLADGVQATLILGVIGGQGFLLGRGNQQISSRVLRRLGKDNVLVVAGAGKVEALDPPLLRVDLGDGERDSILDGYTRVHVAPGRSIVLRVTAD